ncbi:MAG: 3-coathanger stack domain-containing protein [Bacteroidota bacterium]
MLDYNTNKQLTIRRIRDLASFLKRYRLNVFLTLVLSILSLSLSANGTCSNPILLNCGDTVLNQNTANGQDNYQQHGGGNPNYTGPELVYEFEAAAGNVTIMMTNLSADLDVYLLDICTDPVAGEIGFSENGGTQDETININLTAGGTFYIMIDGFNGVSGTFDLSLSCTPLSVNCPTNQAINDNPVTAGTYRADNSLTSTGRVASGTNVNFRAGQTITLSPNFIVEDGATFTARIQACPENLPNRNVNPRSIRIQSKSTISIFPNPVQDQATVVVDLQKAGRVEVVVWDGFSRQIQQITHGHQVAGSRKYQLDLRQFSAGWHIIGIQINGIWQCEKVVKQ